VLLLLHYVRRDFMAALIGNGKALGIAYGKPAPIIPPLMVRV
jgi:hypothetical protein